jgi:hypothetical protein
MALGARDATAGAASGTAGVAQALANSRTQHNSRKGRTPPIEAT